MTNNLFQETKLLARKTKEATMKSLLLIAALVLGTSASTQNSAFGQAPTAAAPSPFPDDLSSARARAVPPLTIAQSAVPYPNAGQSYRSTSSKSSAPPLLIRFLPSEERVLD